MDLRKLKDDELLDLCKKYFYGGFLVLPFLWVVNSCWFFSQAFLRKPSFAQQKEIRIFVILSMIGSIICLSLLIAWNVYFQVNRSSLPWGDNMSFIIPKGIP